MIYLHLFLGFLKVGCFAFGGAYGAIPLIRDVVLSNGWLSDDKLTYIIAVSESTPGPIMLNVASYVGIEQAGLLGAVAATLAVVLPSFFIILLITASFSHILKTFTVQSVLKGLKPSIIGIICATGIYMIEQRLFYTEAAQEAFSLKALIITIIAAGVMFVPKHLFKKPVSPFIVIVLSAILGIIIF